MGLKIDTGCMVADDVTIDNVPQAEQLILSLPWRGPNVEVFASQPSSSGNVGNQTLLNALVRIYAVAYDGTRAEIGRGRAPSNRGQTPIKGGTGRVVARAYGHPCDHYEVTVAYGWESTNGYNPNANRPIQFTAYAWSGQGNVDPVLSSYYTVGFEGDYIVGGDARLVEIIAYNQTANDAWLMLFDVAPHNGAIVADGTHPSFAVYVPGNGNGGVKFEAPMNFVNGICWWPNNAPATMVGASLVPFTVQATFQ